jgi:hypothetical protein
VSEAPGFSSGRNRRVADRKARRDGNPVLLYNQEISQTIWYTCTTDLPPGYLFAACGPQEDSQKKKSAMLPFVLSLSKGRP